MNDTEYLNQSENNKERLQQSIKQGKAKKSKTDYLLYDIEEGLKELNYLELNYIKKVCDMLIAKTNIY